SFMPPKPDMSFSGLEEFTSEPIVIKHIVEKNKAKASEAKPKAVRKNNNAPIIEDWVSDSEEENVSQTKIEKKLLWEGESSEFCQKTHPFPKKNMVPRAVLMKFVLVSLNTARQVNTAHPKITMNSARPMINLSKSTHSTIKWPIHKNTTFKNSNFNQRVNTVKNKNVNTVRPKAVVNAARPKAVVNLVKGNNVNVAKASAYWIQVSDGLVSQKKLIFLSNVQGNPQMDLQDQGVIDNHLGKFDGKADEGFFVGYSINSKAFREVDQIGFLILIALSKSMNYKPVVAGNQSNVNTGTKACDDAGKARMETSSPDDGFKPSRDDEKKVTEEPGKEGNDLSKKDERGDQEKDASVNSTNNVNTSSTNEVNVVGRKTSIELPDEPNMPTLEDIVYSDDDEDVGAEADMNNLDAFMPVSPIPTTRVHKDHPVEQIIEELNSSPQTTRMTKKLEEHGLFSLVQQRTNHKDFQNCLFFCFLSQVEPKKVIQALQDPRWIEAMLDELLQFKLQKVWTLVDLPNGKRPIGTKWVFRNKKDERGIVIKNKAILVAQWYTQEERIDYDEVFAHVARIKAIRLFLAYDSFKDFVVYQMDVKSAFLYGNIEKEVYVCQPPRFEDPNFPDRVYKVEKTDIMFAVCACARYHVNLKVSHLHAVKMIFSDYARASLDRKSTTGGCQFLGNGLISCQCKKQTLVANSITKAEYVVASSCCGQVKTVNGEVQLQALVDGKKIIVTEASVRRGLQLNDEEGTDCLPNATIFEELIKMGNMRRVGKCFSGRETPLFPTMMVQAQEEMGEGSANPTDPNHTPTIIQPSTSQPQKKQKPRKPKRKDTEVPQPSGPTDNVGDEVVYEKMDDSLERAATTVTSLDVEQDKGNINKTESKTTPNEPSSLGTSSGGGPRRQETMGDTIAQTGFENVSKTSNDLLLAGVNTHRSDEDSLKLKELTELCTNLQNRVIDLEKTKTSQAQEIISLKRRVKILEKKGGSRTHGLKRLYKVGLSRRVESSEDEGLDEEDASKQGRIADIDADAGINLVSTHFDADTDMFGVHDLVGDEVVVESEVVVKAASTIPVSAATTTKTVITDDEITLAKALAKLRSAKLPTTTAATTITAVSTRPRAKGLVIHEEEQATTPIISSQQPSQLNVQDKAEEEEERFAREKAQRIEQANIVSWDNVQAMIDVDYQMAQQMQAEEKEKLSIEEKSKLFVQLLEARKKHFAAIRAQEKRNKPPTKAQKRNTMSTYLKNMTGYKNNQLKNKSFDDIQRLFEKTMKKVNTFVDTETELVEGSKVRAEVEIAQESSSKRAGTELEQEKVAIDAIPLATKPPSIVDYKIHKEGKKSYYQIIKVDGSSKMYLVFSHMFKSFDREDLETLWKLVKVKHGSTRPEEGYERVP
ncbi:retrovirus-related pol polyprotein from transposon TNT 1-94, partial [Tanacetum coccineum]